MHNVAMPVSNNLYFNMLWLVNKFFKENRIITKCIFRFTSCFFKILLQVFIGSYNPHAPATAACSSVCDCLAETSP